MTISPEEASATLASINASKRRLAAVAECPPQRHLAFALLMGTLISVPGVPITVAFVLEALIVVGVVLVIRWDKRRTGMFINGYRRGRTRPLVAILLGTMIALVIAGILLKVAGIAWAPFAMGAVGVGVAYAFSVQWQKIFLRELGVEG